MSQLSQDHVINDALKQPLHFVKMNFDCWERIFDLLSLRDILAMSHTCQQMCEIGGHYFHENFRGVSCDLLGEKYCIGGFEFERNDFIQSIDELAITGQLNDMNHFSNVELYRSLTTLLLHETDLTENQVEALKNILNNVLCVELLECTMHEEVFMRFLGYCSKLKYLRIYGGHFEPTNAANELFLQRHPTLEYFHYELASYEFNPLRIIPLKFFLERNPNLKCLEMDDDFIWTNRDTLIETNVHLECLAIRINSAKMGAVEFAHLLKTLAGRGFYEALHLSIEWVPESFDCQKFINEMIAVKSFEVLCSQFYIDLTHLTQLKELRVLGREFEADFQTLAVNLSQIERLHLSATTTDHFLPFIRHSKTLQTIQVNKLMSGTHLNGNTVNVFALNLEREKLENAHKVTIGMLEENIYLATKWAMKNSKSRLVDIERGDKIEFNFDLMNKYLV